MRWTLSANDKLETAVIVGEHLLRGRRPTDVLHLVEVVLNVLGVPTLAHEVTVDKGRLLGIALLVGHILRLEFMSPIIVGVDDIGGTERASIFRVWFVGKITLGPCSHGGGAV